MASHPLATEPLKQRRSTVVVDTTLFSDLQVHQHWHDVFQHWVWLLVLCCFTSMVMWGRSVNVTTLFVDRLRPPKQLTSITVHILSPLALPESAEGETKVRWRTGHRTSDLWLLSLTLRPGRVAQSVGHLTSKSGVLGSIPGLATYFRSSFHFFKKGSCQLLARVCARSTGSPLRRSKPAQEKCG